MKKNKVTAYLIILFVLVVTLPIGFLSINSNSGVISLIMMILMEFGVLAALIIGVNKK